MSVGIVSVSVSVAPSLETSTVNGMLVYSPGATSYSSAGWTLTQVPSLEMPLSSMAKLTGVPFTLVRMSPNSHSRLEQISEEPMP